MPTNASEPVIVEWPLWRGLLLRSYIAVGFLLPWFLLIWALRFGENRNRRARRILWALAASIIVAVAPGLIDLQDLRFYMAFVPIGLLWTVIGLRTEYLAAQTGRRRLLVTLVLCVVFGLCMLMFAGDFELLVPAAFAFVLFPQLLARYECRSRFTVRRFAVMCAGGYVLTAVLVSLVAFLILARYNEEILSFLAVAAVVAVWLYAMQLPYLILVSKSPLYRQRFEALLGFNELGKEEGADSPEVQELPSTGVR